MSFTGLPGWAVGLSILGCAGVLFLVHLLRIRPRERTVPTLLFWRKVLLESQARRLGGRFRHPRTWAFLVLTAALLVLALGRPEREGVGAAPLVLVLDVGPSMEAALGNDAGTRFEQAREGVLRWVDGAPLSRPVTVVTTSAREGNVADPETPRALVEARVRALEVDSLARPIAGVLAEVVGRDAAADVHVFSDRDPGVAPPPRVTWHRSVSELPDQAIAGAGFLAGLRVRVLGPPIEGRVLVVRDEVGTELARAPLVYREGEDLGEGLVPDLRASGDVVTLVLEPADALPTNDRVRYRLPSRTTKRVFVDAALPAAVRLLCEQDDHLNIVDDAAMADVALAPSPVQVADLDLVAVAHEPLAAPYPIVDRAGMDEMRAVARMEDDALAVARFAGRVLAMRRTRPDGGRVLALPPALVDARGPWMQRPERTAELIEWIHASAGSTPGSIAIAENAGSTLVVARTDVAGSVLGAVDERLVRPFEPVGTLTNLDADGTSTASVVAMSAIPRATSTERDVDVDAGSRDFEWFEWLIACALFLFLIDAWLHLSGRIP